MGHEGITVLLTGVVLASLSLGCAQTKTQLLPSHLSVRTVAEWVAEDHRTAAQLYTQEATRLEGKVANLERRLEKFTKKPYLDTKGFKRQSVRRLSGTYRKEISELGERIAWHQEKVDWLNAKSPSDEIEKRGEDKKSS